MNLPIKHAGLILGLFVLWFLMVNAQTNPSGSNPILTGKTVNNYPVVRGDADARTLFNLMAQNLGKQAFLIETGTGSDFTKTFVIVEEDEGEEAYVYQKIGEAYKRLDCEQSFWQFTFSATALDFEPYLGYTSYVSIGNGILENDDVCQQNSAEGNYDISSWIGQLRFGKEALQRYTQTPQPTPPGTQPIPGTPPTNASTPVSTDACELGNGSIERIKMGDKFKEGKTLANKIMISDTGEYFLQPRNIIFTDSKTDEDKYLVQVWHFSSNESIAASIIDRIDTAEAIAWDNIKSIVGQTVFDYPLAWLELLGISVDVAHPIETASKSIQTYNQKYGDKSPTVTTNKIIVLPGIGNLGKTAIGMRLCVFENGTAKSYWGQVAHEKISLGNYRATFISTQRGAVTINYEVIGNENLTSLEIDTSSDKIESVFRFRLSDETLNQLKQNTPLFNDPNQDGDTRDALTLKDIQTKIEATLKRKSDGKKWVMKNVSAQEGILFGSPNPPYLTSASITEPTSPSIGRPTEIDASQPVSPGEYELNLTIAGFKDYKTSIAITPSGMLSTEETQKVQEKDIFKLTIKDLKLVQNCSSACTDIATCLACLTSGIVENY